MLHIIGVSHQVQSRKSDDEESEAHHAFSRLLKQIIQEVHPTFVAEEESEENLLEHQKVSIVKEIADSERVEHRFCDPNRAQRKAIGYLRSDEILSRLRDLLGKNLRFEECSLRASAIEVGQHFRKRERFWLQGLNGCHEQDVLFVCGDGHIESFTELLKNEGIPYKVLERGVGMTEADHEKVRGILQYLEAHPELRNG
jgi:hypothetical protein